MKILEERAAREAEATDGQEVLPPAGRPAKASGARPAPVRKGVTSGSARQRASLDVPWNPLGVVNGPSDSGKAQHGQAARKRATGQLDGAVRLQAVPRR